MTQKELNRQYQDQLNRLRRQERRMRERGYTFETEEGDYIGFVPQKILQRPTAASIRKLERIRGKVFYEEGSFVDPYTGELMSAAEGRKAEFKRAAEKREKTRKIGITPPAPTPPSGPPAEPPSGGMSSDEIRSAVVSLLQYSSGLAEYGGWINDKGKGRGIGGIRYTDFAKRNIAEIETMMRGMLNDELQLAWDMIVSRVESQMAYEAFGGGLGNDAKSAVAEFKSWTQYFQETVEIIKSALTDAVLAFS